MPNVDHVNMNGAPREHSGLHDQNWRSPGLDLPVDLHAVLVPASSLRSSATPVDCNGLIQKY